MLIFSRCLRGVGFRLISFSRINRSRMNFFLVYVLFVWYNETIIEPRENVCWSYYQQILVSFFMKTFATNKHHLIDQITPNRWKSRICWWDFLISLHPSPIWGVKIEWDKLQIKMRGRYWTQQNGLFLNCLILSGRLQLGLTILFNVLRRGRWVLGINCKAICR